MQKSLILSAALGVYLSALLAPTGHAQRVTEILNSTGDGIHAFDTAGRLTLDSAGNVYATAILSDNAFKVTPSGVITQIIDASGDGQNFLRGAAAIALGANGNVYVTGNSSRNCFEIKPNGVITEIIDSTGDAAGNTLNNPIGCCVGPSGNVYVSGRSTSNVFRITPAGVITEIIDATGDGTHNLTQAVALAVDAAENVYVIGELSHNVFKITPAGAITQIIDASGDGMGNTLELPFGIAADASGNVYVTGTYNAFKVTQAGVITEIIDTTAGGTGLSLVSTTAIAVSNVTGNVYVSGAGLFWGGSNNVLQITPSGTISQILHIGGDGMGATLDYPISLAVDASENVFANGLFSDNVFRIEAGYGDLGTNYCTANPNSTGAAGTISAFGRRLAVNNKVTLTASNLPAQSFGFFITSMTQGFVALPSGSDGNLCVGGSIGRYVGTGQIQNSGSTDSFSLELDLAQTPTPTGLVTVNAGEAWNFQAWHRDTAMGTPTSNFTDGIEITFK